MLVQAMVDVLLVVAAIDALGLGQQGAGWVSAAWGIGGVAGGVIATLLVARNRLARGLRPGFVLAGLPLIAIAAVPHAELAVAALVVLGIGYGIMEVALLTLTQRLVAGDVLARVYGAQETLGVGAMAVGSIAASALVGLLGIRGALLATGALLPLVAILARRRLRTLQAGAAAPDGAVELLRRVSIFAPLPMATVESLALRARPRHAEPGEEIVREGDSGQTFYVIESGHVEVLERDVPRRRQTAGEHFGEVALLRGAPRSATVRAGTPVTLLAIDGAELLAAVASHPRSRHALDAIATQRLAAAGSPYSS